MLGDKRQIIFCCQTVGLTDKKSTHKKDKIVIKHWRSVFCNTDVMSVEIFNDPALTKMNLICTKQTSSLQQATF